MKEVKEIKVSLAHLVSSVVVAGILVAWLPFAMDKLNASEGNQPPVLGEVTATDGYIGATEADGIECNTAIPSPIGNETCKLNQVTFTVSDPDGNQQLTVIVEAIREADNALITVTTFSLQPNEYGMKTIKWYPHLTPENELPGFYKFRVRASDGGAPVTSSLSNRVIYL